MGSYPFGDALIGPDGRAQDDQIGTLNSLGRIKRVDITQPQRPRLLQRFRRAGGNGDRFGQSVTTRCQRDGRADQANADQRQFAKGSTHEILTSACRMPATPRIAFSDPMEIRNPLGMP